MLQVNIDTVVFNQIRNYRGLEFQDFGDRLLSKLYPNEYIAVRAGGPWGDLKNDGYCHINRTFFHFYASSQHNVAALKAKITTDIKGCLAKQQQVDKIIFVTNDANLGVIEAHIDDLRLKHRIAIDTWGPNRLVKMICAMPQNDIATIMNMVQTEQLQHAQGDHSMSVKYFLNNAPAATWSRRTVTICACICVLSGIAFPIVFFYGFNPMPFGWYCLTLFLLFGFCISLSGFVSMASRSSSGQWVQGDLFYRKEGDQYLGFHKVANCPYPNCEGSLFVQEAPEKEKHRFKLVGCCTVEPKVHTFSYNHNDTGYPVQLDFSSAK